MTKFFKSAALAAAATVGMMATLPATAATTFVAAPAAGAVQGLNPFAVSDGDSWDHYRRDGRRYREYRGDRYYGEPVYRGSRSWRGRDGRMYCRRSNGTTGLIIGGAAGALLGRELDGGYNRTTGTVLGAAGGALLGRSIDRNRRCR